MGMLLDDKDFIMSIVLSMGYCIEVVGEEGQERVGQTGGRLHCHTLADLLDTLL